MKKALDNSIFLVNDEPYCIWEVNLPERNRDFLNGIDTGYFDYALDAHLNTEDEQRASIALRITLHHAIETMFSLLGAYIQAPNCAYAWIAKCSNIALRKLVENIGRPQNALFTKLKVDQVSWESVARLVFRCYKPGTEKNEKTIKLFASLWQRLAHEFTDSTNIAEYNSLKHGLRVNPGGFSLAVGKEHEYGVAPPSNEMKTVGQSVFGTSFLKVEKARSEKEDRGLISKPISLNWSIEKVVFLIRLVSMSITNLASALKIANGVSATTCKFLRPEEDSVFDEPWQYEPGVTSCSFDFIINEDDIVSSTKKELLKKINGRKKG